MHGDKVDQVEQETAEWIHDDVAIAPTEIPLLMDKGRVACARLPQVTSQREAPYRSMIAQGQLTVSSAESATFSRRRQGSRCDARGGEKAAECRPVEEHHRPSLHF